jgi:hypothetical protein
MSTGGMTGIIVRSFAFSQAKSSEESRYMFSHGPSQQMTAAEYTVRLHRSLPAAAHQGRRPGAERDRAPRGPRRAAEPASPGRESNFYKKNRITYAATGAASTLPTLLYTAPFPHRYVVYADRHVLRLHTAVAIHQQRSAARPTLARATPPHRERTLSHQFRALDGHLKKLARPRTNNRSAVQFRDAAAGATRATPRQGHHMERRPRGRLGDRVDGI